MDAETDYDVGLVLSINNQPLTIYPTKALKNDSSVPQTYALDRPLYIGTPAQFATFIGEAFNIKDTVDFSKLPAPLDAIATKLGTLQVRLERFSITIPASKDATDNPLAEDKKRPITFDMTTSVSWAEGEEVQIFGKALAIKGLVFDVHRRVKGESRDMTVLNNLATNTETEEKKLLEEDTARVNEQLKKKKAPEPKK